MKIYNRYAHMQVEISDGPAAEVSLLEPDLIRLNIGADRLPEISVGYVISDKDLSCFNINGLTFNSVYTQQNGSYTIYRVDD